MAGREHVLEKGKVHRKWDQRSPPVIEIDPGDTVHCETIDVTNNQITPSSPASALGSLDFGQLYPLAGPILTRTAEPGDVLEVEILRFETLGRGYADLTISQIVDQPNFGVSAYLALSVFTDDQRVR